MKTLARRHGVGGSRREAGSTSADKPFGRYGPMDKHEVRKPDVKHQSYLDQARKAREMLKDMAPDKVLQLIEFHKGLNFFQALALAQREEKLIVPHYVHHRIITETAAGGSPNVYKYFMFTGTLLVCEAPNEPFGKKVVYNLEVVGNNSYVPYFKIPKKFQGKVNCALVLEHPDFEILEAGDSRYELKSKKGAKIHLVEDFPRKDGIYRGDVQIAVPHGEELEEYQGLLERLSRTLPEQKPEQIMHLDRKGTPYISPIVRSVNKVDPMGFNVHVGHSLFGQFGLAFFKSPSSL